MTLSQKSNSAVLSEAQSIIDAGVNTRASLFEALPMAKELLFRLSTLKRTADALREAADALHDLAAKYAENHTSVFDAGLLVEEREGIFVGDVTIGDTVFHFVKTKGLPVRIDGGNLTGGFLASLPECAVKRVPKLDVDGLKRAGWDTEEKLAEYGLFRPDRCMWTTPAANAE